MKNKIFLFVLVLLAFLGNAQDLNFKHVLDISDLELDVNKFGPYIGLQQGKYSSVEFGAEFQHKKIKWIRPTTHSVHLGFNYNFYNNLLGYDVGYWYKAGRLNLTYGVSAIFRTDYTHNAIGFAPVVGYKIGQLHMQTGYNFLSRTTTNFPCNTFFMTLRFVLVQYRNFDWKK
jgi:hypothetical protein